MQPSTKPAPRNFASVETWVFDLDNTLYPHDLNLWQQIDDRIRSFVSNFLKVTKEEAFRVQKDYYKRYGTTMRGLMAEHGMKPDDFLEFVHQIDHSPLLRNAELGNAIEKLPGRKLILTNGTRKHAEAVMKRLEIDRHFEDVFDIAAADLDPKPHPQVYDRFLKKHGVEPGKAAISSRTRAALCRYDGLCKTVRTAAPTASGVRSCGPTTVAVPSAAQRRAFSGWSALIGSITSGSPIASAAIVVFQPPWVMTRSQRGKRSDCGM